VQIVPGVGGGAGPPGGAGRRGGAGGGDDFDRVTNYITNRTRELILRTNNQPTNAQLRQLYTDLRRVIGIRYRNIPQAEIDRLIRITVQRERRRFNDSWGRYDRELQDEQQRLNDRLNYGEITQAELARRLAESEERLRREILQEPQEIQTRRAREAESRRAEQYRTQRDLEINDWLVNRGFDRDSIANAPRATRREFSEFLRGRDADLRRDILHEAPRRREGEARGHLGGIAGSLIMLTAGLMLSALLGSAWFSFAFILFMIYMLIPPPERPEEAILQIPGIGNIVRRYNRQNRTAREGIRRGLFTVGLVMLVIAFFTSTIPLAKFVGLVAAFITYFVLGPAPTREEADRGLQGRYREGGE
jgi:hypothetical protein